MERMQELLDRFLKSEEFPKKPYYGQYFMWKCHWFAFTGKEWCIVD